MMNENTKQIIDLANGERSSKEIAKIVGLTPRYVRKVMSRHNLPMLPSGSQRGERNHQYKSGRHIDQDGYATVPTPEGHETGRKIGRIAEHRLVMEQSLGRPLEHGEVVDHIDGLTLHNAPENLRLFASNSEHLKATISGKIPKWSAKGRENVLIGRRRQRVDLPVDTYRLRKKRGDVRLQQILRAALALGTDSPYLSGMSHHLKKAGIADLSPTSLERALDDLYRRCASDHAL